MSGQKKQIFLYAGIGFVAIGVASAVFIYLFVYQQPSNQTNKFTLEEVHADPKLVMHDHVSLAITVNGEKIVVPQEIGIKPELWKDHSLDKYGPAGLSPMHTHDTSGVIHIESTANKEYTFGEFLRVWGIDTSKIASVTVDGNGVSDYEDHVMKRGEKLQMEMTK